MERTDEENILHFQKVDDISELKFLLSIATRSPLRVLKCQVGRIHDSMLVTGS